MAEWTVILTAVGAAGATGWFGYLGIRRSTDVTMKQIAEETARAHEQIQAENERLRAQHREDHLRNRQGTYHALLSADQELEKAILGTGDAQEAFAKFSHLGNGTAIFGTESVQVAITAILAQYVEVFREAKKRAGDTTTSADVQTVYKEHAQRIVAARTALAEAMREDVGPQ